MKKNIKAVVKRIKEASDAYYNAQPIISDEEYDSLIDELRELDPNNEALKSIGAAPKEDSKLKKVKHNIPMGSLDKVNTQEDFEKWAKGTGTAKYAIQEKLDGLSIEVIYKDGVFKQAITRGDGEIGEDVTHNVTQMQNVPKKLPIAFSGSLRGECIITKEDFEKHFAGDKYTTARNTAAGMTRRKDTDLRTKLLWVIYFDALRDGIGFNNVKEKMDFIQDELKLVTVASYFVGLENAIKWYNYYKDEFRATLQHEIDGMVIKTNDDEEQSIAWKFASEMRETILKDITWEIGKTGRITPVALISPVQIGGVTISKVTLHNAANVKKLELQYEDTILVSRAGDVIPYFVKVIKHSDTRRPLDVPDECPACHCALFWEGDYLVCKNPSCPGKVRGDFSKWIQILGVDNAGEAFINTIIDLGFVKDIADLYTLDVEEVASVSGYGDVSANRVISNIKKKMELDFPTFLAGLNISNCSLATFETLERAGWDSLEKLYGAGVEHLEGISGIGNITASQIVAGLLEKKDLIEKLLVNGIVIKKKTVGKLSGMSFCFTGEISIKRSSAQKIVRGLGGEVKSSVSKGLTYLVQADPKSQSGKSQKARSYGTKVIGEDEFFELVDFSVKLLEQFA